jgi:ribulose-5-phosphate 4-epimerase/fuculose-1-phosphate aldolase
MLADAICAALCKRKGCIVEGIGMVSHGALTVEQAYIAWSSLLHATTIKYLEDLLANGPLLQEEKETLEGYRVNCLRPLSISRFLFSAKAPTQPEEILSEMSLAGKATVQLGLVDSFFGNISCRTENTLYISQTSARLDELSGQIDTLPFDGSSTAGITASSELPAHKAMYKTTGCKVILHGHPRFSVILSFFAAVDNHAGIAMLGAIPVVGGEGGVGGLAESLSKAFSLTTAKAVIVRGHGIFALSDTDFGEALAALIEVEHYCRELYFSKLSERYQLFI